ncbi:MAG: GMC family oxidoreductase [Pannonibacter sp.]
MTETFDYVVIGAGSAGSAVAHRLVNAGKTVLLLEAGPADNSMFVHIPATFVRVIGTARTWLYQSEPQPHAEGRVMHIPQGRTLGGGSSVNAMIYIRGQRQDYDTWAAMGARGWAYADVLPYFRRAENNQRLSNAWHGADGPQSVSDPRHRHPLSLAFVKAAQEAGHAYNDDFNGAEQAGTGFYQSTTGNGQRASTAVAYLKPLKGNSKLVVRTGCAVSRLIIENGAATGLSYRREDGGEHTVHARAEVVLSAGALATPKLMMLSGLGPAAELEPLGIPVLRDLPGVGRNFQDHLEVSVYARAKDPISLLGADRGLKAIRHGLQYVMTKSGLLTSNVVECGGFFDTSGSGRPDIQFHVIPTLMGDVGREPLAGHGMSLNPCFLRPKSRGTVKLRSADPNEPILLDPNFLAEQDDVDTLVRGVKLARRILRQPSLQKLIERELLPSEAETLSDAQIEDHVRRYAKTVYHPSGTCRMGEDDEAVVDSQLRVRGIGRLRIADASVMPTLVSGNTNAPSIMIGERCADFLLGRG